MTETLRPQTRGALLQKAVAYHQAGDLERAIVAYRQVLGGSPRDPDALHMLGVALGQTGHPADAVPLLQAAVEAYPNSAMVHLNLGNALNALRRQAEALACYRRAARLAPERIEIHEAMCRTALALGEHSDVLASSGNVLALRPDHWDAHAQRAISLAKLGRLTEAEQRFTRAAALNPTNALLHCHLGNLYVSLGRHELAAASLARALELEPGDIDAGWNLALVRLVRGELREGWELYELRFAMDALRGHTRRYGERRFTGREDLRGKRLLLWSERGLGDTLQFSRYAPLIRDMGAEVTIEVQPSLTALLARQFPGVRVIGRGAPVPDFDYQCPLLSVAGALGTELDTIPADVPYLKADPAAVERWSRRLPAGDALRVGIVWQGNPDAERNWASGRSWPLAALEPLSRRPGVRLISLQTGAGAEQVTSAGFAERIVSFGEELDAGPYAFIDTAAILMSLDLLITCDTSVAHLAGALGVPTWVGLHTTSEWRWLLEREDSPWYPAMRLFRQRTAGDWSSVVRDMCRELATCAAVRRHP